MVVMMIGADEGDDSWGGVDDDDGDVGDDDGDVGDDDSDVDDDDGDGVFLVERQKDGCLAPAAKSKKAKSKWFKAGVAWQ